MNTFAELREQERLVRRRIIVDAAERVFGSKPFLKVSMRDIAREAGISPASIYRYFPDQQTLFVEAFILGARELIDLIGRVIDGHDGLPLAEIAGVYLDFLTEKDHYFRMMTHFMLDGQLSDEPLDKLNETERSLLDQIDRVFRRIKPESQVRLLSHAFMAALNGVMISFRNYPGRTAEEVRRHMDQVVATIITGLSLEGR